MKVEDWLCSRRSRLEQITPGLKMATLPALKTHKRKLLCGIEFSGLLKRKGRAGNSKEDDEKDLIPIDLEVARLPGKSGMKCLCVSKMEGRNGIDKEDDEQEKRADLIPGDLEVSIQTRFPGKSLSKCICVSKMEGRDKEDNEQEKRGVGIPVDLEEAILTRLPGKSLIKFQCVSKMWYSIIRSQRFIDSFFARSLATRFIIAFSNGPAAMSNDRLFIFSSSHEGEESSSLETNLEMTIPSTALAAASRCGSVHGFIGCSKHGDFLVCNPTTRKLTFLPGSGGHTYFGYDPVGRQFKALNLVSPWYGGPYDCLVHDVITLGGGGGGGGERNRLTTPPYYSVTQGVCINGFVYFGAWAPTRGTNPVIVCFDVRYETVSFIKAPQSVVHREGQSILIEYQGKLASIVRNPDAPFHSFDLCILEDVKKHHWSNQTFELPFSLARVGRDMTSPGTNQAGEIIFAPILLSRDVQPFFIFYYNVERKDLRKVILRGIADDEEFRRRYGLVDYCPVRISPQHLESIDSL